MALRQPSSVYGSPLRRPTRGGSILDTPVSSQPWPLATPAPVAPAPTTAFNPYNSIRTPQLPAGSGMYNAYAPGNYMALTSGGLMSNLPTAPRSIRQPAAPAIPGTTPPGGTVGAQPPSGTTPAIPGGTGGPATPAVPANRMFETWLNGVLQSARAINYPSPFNRQTGAYDPGMAAQFPQQVQQQAQQLRQQAQQPTGINPLMDLLRRS